MRVLMATDGSKRATNALIAAGRMLSTGHREIDLMCVVPKVPQHGRHSHQERVCRHAQHIVNKTKEKLAAEGLHAQTLVRVGSPTRTLIEASYNYDVTVVAAASRRTGPMAGLGPVASRVAEHSGRTTLLAREGRSEPGCRILVAVDGSEASLRALDRMVEVVDLAGAEVTLLHVVETPWLHPGPDQEWLGYLEDEEEKIDLPAQFQEEFVIESDAILATASGRLPARTTVNTLIYEGLPADEILSEADRGDYDMVAIGATGSTDLKHRILGSVSTKVAWNAPCSVLLVGVASEQERS